MTDKLNAENLKNYLGEHGGYLTKKPNHTMLQIYRKHDLPARDGVEAMLTTVLNR